MAERIELDQLTGLAWQRAWMSGGAEIRIGETSDGRWIVWHSRRGSAWMHYDERSACRQVDRLVSRGVWRQLDRAV